MSLCGVEYSPFSCDRYFAVDGVVAGVVVAACLPVFITVPASRVYTGILMGLALVFILKLWRLLPSHRRWVERHAERRAERLVSQWRTAPPTTTRQVIYNTPTALTGIAEVSATSTTPNTTARMHAAVGDGAGGVAPYGYYSRSPYCSPLPGTPRGSVMGPPLRRSLSLSLPPTAAATPVSVPPLLLPSSQLLCKGQEMAELGGGRAPQQQQQEQARSPWQSPLPTVSEASQRSFSPRLGVPSSPRSASSPYLLLPPPPPPLQLAASSHIAEVPWSLDSDAAESCTAVKDNVWCLHTSRSVSAHSPPPHRLCSPSARARRMEGKVMVRRSRSPPGPTHVFSEASLPASYRPVAAASGARSGAADWPLQRLPASHRHQHRHQHRHHERRCPRTHGSRHRRASPSSTASSGSVDSDASSVPRSPVWDDAAYVVATGPASQLAFPNRYG
jgi:hypothetical protein